MVMNGEEHFGRIGSFFYPYLARTKIMERFYGYIVSDLSGYSFRTVLDLGCGTGNVATALAGRKEAEFYCVDPSPFMIKRAKAAAEKKHLRNFHFMVGGSRNIPYEMKFDLIYSSLSFHHWAGLEESMREIGRHLNENSSFIVYKFSRERLRGMLKAIGSHAIGRDDIASFRYRNFTTGYTEHDPYIKIVFTYRGQAADKKNDI